MLQTQFPVSHGRYAFLKVLSGEGDGPVYLAALSRAKVPWVIKILPLRGPGAAGLHALKAESKVLARMHSAHLAAVLAPTEVEDDGGFVMEHVPGKSLAAISRRAEEYSLLLPPELGLVLAHDAFSAAAFFHGFEGSLRVHGNISPSTILVGYSGDVKIAGYRPGSHPPSGVGAQVARDLKPLATILCDLPFESFPKELATLVPRLLEDSVSPVEATAAVRAFLHDHTPSVDQRRRLATWLADVFPGQREEEAREEARLLAAGMQLLTPVLERPSAKRVSMFGGATALLALLGGGALLMSNRRPAESDSGTTHEEHPAKVSAGQTFELSVRAAQAPSPAPAVPAESAPADPSLVAVKRPKPTSDAPIDGLSKHVPTESPTDRLLRAADAAFGAGKRIEAIGLGLQAVNAGGGVRAHLALGEYYRSMHRYQEAMNHYRAAAEIEPENQLALAGVRMLEKKLSPCR